MIHLEVAEQMGTPYPIPDFLAAVHAEWQRARELFPDQEETLNLHEWLATITEEVGEIARALNENMNGNFSVWLTLDNLRTELIQTAAMCGRMRARAVSN